MHASSISKLSKVESYSLLEGLRSGLVLRLSSFLGALSCDFAFLSQSYSL